MHTTEFNLLKRQLPRVRENASLKEHTTFRIGGPAKYFFAAKTSKDVERAVGAARKLKLPFLLLSGGSNVLLPDEGFTGLVIKIQTTNYKIQDTKVWAEAGVSMEQLVRETGKRGLSGLEWAGGLPGTLGGGVRGNAGAFGGEMKDSIAQVVALDKKGVRRTFSKRQCKFAYRSSVFKEKGYIVLSATIKLMRGNKKEIQAIAHTHIRYRKERHPLELPNAGSIFKNCDFQKVPRELRNELKDAVKVDPVPVVPAAHLIARADLIGSRVGDAEISSRHPNYIVNKGNARASDVLALVAKVKKRVRERFGIELEEEISFFPPGFFEKPGGEGFPH